MTMLDRNSFLAGKLREFYKNHPTSTELLEAANALDTLSSIPEQGAGVKPEWRCFHCDEIFTDEQSAREHFGPDQDSTPACQIKAGAERSLVRALRAAEAATADAIHGMHDESTEGYKAYYAANSRFNAAVQAAEEAGYERGMLDMRAELSAPSQPAAVGVTDEMVEAIVQAVRPYTLATLFLEEHRDLVRAALRSTP